MNKALVYSAIQPTGKLHIGNYLGAIRQWLYIQDSVVKDEDAAASSVGDEGTSSSANPRATEAVIFGLADMHALTTFANHSKNHLNALGMATELLSLGLDPQKVILKRSSRVPEHANLAWILACLAPMGRLKNMTQFKAKSKGDVFAESGTTSVTEGPEAKAGLFLYPVLQAADILIYRARQVPVGHDQFQHLEFARELAKKFNDTFQTDFFPLPTPFCGGAIPENSLSSSLRAPTKLQESMLRIKSLVNGRTKMSKSDPEENSRINLTDSSEIIRKKIMKATTDNHHYLVFNPESSPEISNLLAIYKSCRLIQASLNPSKLTKEEGDDRDPDAIDICHYYNSLSSHSRYATFKNDLVELLLDALKPFRQKYAVLEKDPHYVLQVLERGEEKARFIASTNMKEIREICHL